MSSNRGFSKRQETKATCNWLTWKKKIGGRRSEALIYIAADVHASWEKVTQTRPSHNINMINMALQTNAS